MRTELCRGVAAAEHSFNVESRPVVRPTAARRVTLSSRVRAGTTEEKASVPPPAATHSRGLTVHEDTGDALIAILSCLKEKPERSVEVE